MPGSIHSGCYFMLWLKMVTSCSFKQLFCLHGCKWYGMVLDEGYRPCKGRRSSSIKPLGTCLESSGNLIDRVLNMFMLSKNLMQKTKFFH